MQLLIVDDSNIERMILKEMLQSEGYAVQEAENGKQALRMALLSCPDIIISDILMPVMDGFKLCREIRADSRTCNIPFVFYTGTYTKAEDEDFAFKMGADRFLIKSTEWSDFFKALQDVIREKEMGETVLPEDSSPENFFPKKSSIDEKEVYKLYNERLIKKLEDKVTELEQEVGWRKKLEKQLYDSQESLQLALEGAHLGMWDWNIQTGNVRFNQKWLEQFGYEPEDVMPDISFWGKLMHPDDQQRSRDLLNANLDGDIEIYENECRVKNKFGHWQWIFARGKVSSRDEAGKPLRHVGTLIEVSDRKNALIALEKSHAQMEKQVEIRTSDLSNANQQLKEEILLRNKIETALAKQNEHLDELVAERTSELQNVSEALGEEKERYRLIFNTAPIGIFHYNSDGVVTECNSVCLEMTGASREKFIGLNIFELVKNEDLIKAVKASLSGKTVHAKGGYTSVTGGRKFYAMADFAPVMSYDEKIQGGICVVRDVSASIKAKKALQKSEEKYRTILESIEDGYFEVDLAGHLTFFNNAMAHILGYPASELKGKNYRLFMDEEYTQKTFQKFNQVFKSGRSGKEFDWKIIRKNGDSRYLDALVAPIMDAKEYTIGFRGVVRDVSERRLMQKNLAESEEKYKRLADNSPGIILLTDSDGVCRFVSPSIERILGYRPEEVLGTVPVDFYTTEYAHMIMNTISKAMKGEPVNRFEVELLRKDGANAVLELDCIPVREETRIVGVQYLAKDITEQKKAENALKSSRRQLRELSKHLQNSREQERAGIAREIHDDLGQSLTAIKMNAVWLKSKIPEDRAELHCKTEDTIFLVDSAIKTVKRISAELRPGLLDDLGLSAAIEWQAKEYQQRSNIHIDVTIEPEEIVLAEDLSIAIFRVCQETLTNVIRHAGATEVRVCLTKKSKVVEFEVRDNGIGISDKSMDKKNSFGLLGMRERVHAIGGKIHIFRIPEGGTKVSVTVPLVTAVNL